MADRIVERIIGTPLSQARRNEEIERHLLFRDLASYRAIVSENVSHLTQKSGALLAAQAIFLVVETYGIDHGWPRAVVLVSVLTLVFAALLVMSNLRSVWFTSPISDDRTALERKAIEQIARLAAIRGARFNVALYLTFLSVVLLGFGAVASSLP